MKKRLLLATSAVLFSSSALSAPWVEPSDLPLRSSIQLLADAGYINAPVTTYPLMWNSFIEELKQVKPQNLPQNIHVAWQHVLTEFNAQSQTHTLNVSLYGASKAQDFTQTQTPYTNKLAGSLGYAYLGENLAGKVALSYRQDGKNCFNENRTAADIATNDAALTRCDDYSFDHSYLAYRLGNWVIRAGAIEQFWSPSLDTSLILSNNAKPLPALSITREKATAFETPLLSWLGQWTFTAQMAHLEAERHIPNALLWSTRASIRPLKQLEIALSWSAQWGGKEQDNSLGTFFDMIRGKNVCINNQDTCDDEQKSQLGNQLAGIDIRWSDTLFSQPYAIYLSAIGEDAKNSFYPVDRAYLAGIETTAYWFEQNLRFNLEHIDTGVACTGFGSTVENCYYEHSTYRSGYRYHGKNLGSTYGNDTQSLMFSAMGMLKSGDNWQVKLRKLKLNSDNSDAYPQNPDLGNTITKTAQNRTELTLRYQTQLWQGKATLGGTLTHGDGGENAAFIAFEKLF